MSQRSLTWTLVPLPTLLFLSWGCEVNALGLGDNLVGKVPQDTSQCQKSSQPPELWPAVGHGAEVSGQEFHVSLFPTEGYFQVSKTEHL